MLSSIHTNVYTVSCNCSNLEKFLKMKEIFQTIQLVTCSLAIDIASFCKRISLTTNLFRRIMIRLHQVISRTNNTVYLPEYRLPQFIQNTSGVLLTYDDCIISSLLLAGSD